MRGQITLTPNESKELIAKGVAATESVQKAMKDHTIVIAGGTTNSFIARELLGVEFERITDYTVGMIANGKMDLSPDERRVAPFVITKGKPREKGYPWQDFIKEIQHGDIFIKGGNAIDHTGLSGVFAYSDTGGTIGAVWGSVLQRGAQLLVPIGLEKLIPDVRAAVELTVSKPSDMALGYEVTLLPLLGGKSFTEIDALKTLFDLEVTCIGAGGIGNTQGSVTLILEGDKKQVKKAMALVEEIKLK